MFLFVYGVSSSVCFLCWLLMAKLVCSARFELDLPRGLDRAEGAPGKREKHVTVQTSCN